MARTQNARFQRGSGVFKCDCCARNTRNTGQPHGSRLCAECYELAGWENSLSDEGPADFLKHKDDVVGELNRCVERGGNVDLLRKEFAPIVKVLNW